jgi:hypothetical protein
VPVNVSFGDTGYAVAINTLPGQAGIENLPFSSNVRTANGANFLLLLSSAESARLLISTNYSAYQVMPKEGVPDETTLGYRPGFSTSLEERGGFQEMIVETNRLRFGRDGHVFQAQRYSRSPLRFGIADPASQDYDSLAEWWADPGTGTIYVRLAWGKLLLTDPSSKQVFAGYDGSAHLKTLTTRGIELRAMSIRNGDGQNMRSMTVLNAAPEIAQPSSLLTWDNWNKVEPQAYYKKAYYALQTEFARETGVADSGAVTASAAAPGADPKR